MILHQIEALAEAGVTDVVLAVNYRPEIMEKALGEVSGLFFIIAYSPLHLDVIDSQNLSPAVCQEIRHQHRVFYRD